MPEELVYRYVTATLDLAIEPAEGNLLVHRDGEVLLQTTIPRPTG